MRLFIYVLFLMVTITISGKLSAQLEFSGEIRPRTEFSHGYKTLAAEQQDASTFTTQRTRLNLHYKDSLFQTNLTLQDVRLWGNQPQLVANEDFATSIHEAWLKINLPDRFALKAGRQEVTYDNHRIFGNVGWAQQGRSHDMAIFQYAGDMLIDLGFAYNENSNRANNLYTGPDAYKSLQFLWVHKKISNVSLSFLFLNNGIPYTESTGPTGNITDQSIKYSQTIGGYINWRKADFNLKSNLYYQTGKDPLNRDISAFEFLVKGNYNWNQDLNLFAGYEILSGTDYNETNINHSFTPYYGTNHKFNGYMDYFYVGNHLNSVGLHDLNVGFSSSIQKVNVQGKVHLFRSYADIAPGADKFLGVEADLGLSYDYSDQVKFAAGYSHLFPGRSLETLKGGSEEVTQNWAYVMISVTPTFFTN
jgi:hypothetical protein